MICFIARSTKWKQIKIIWIWCDNITMHIAWWCVKERAPTRNTSLYFISDNLHYYSSRWRCRERFQSWAQWKGKHNLTITQHFNFRCLSFQFFFLPLFCPVFRPWFADRGINVGLMNDIFLFLAEWMMLLLVKIYISLICGGEFELVGSFSLRTDSF